MYTGSIGITLILNEGVEELACETIAQLSKLGFGLNYKASENGKKITFTTQADKKVLENIFFQMLLAKKFDNSFFSVNLTDCPKDNYLFSQMYGDWQVCGKIQDEVLNISISRSRPICQCRLAKFSEDANIPDTAMMFDEVINDCNQHN